MLGGRNVISSNLECLPFCSVSSLISGGITEDLVLSRARVPSFLRAAVGGHALFSALGPGLFQCWGAQHHFSAPYSRKLPVATVLSLSVISSPELFPGSGTGCSGHRWESCLQPKVKAPMETISIYCRPSLTLSPPSTCDIPSAWGGGLMILLIMHPLPSLNIRFILFV